MKARVRAFIALGAFVVVSASAAPPNVLLVLTDDQGWGDLSRHGATPLETPRLDAFFAESASFETFYVSPVCAPTRAALLTGRYPLRTGVHGVTRAHETMRAEEVTLAETLRDAGYATGCFGKWHNGANWPHDALGQGFDEFVGFRGGHFNNYHDAVLERNGEPYPTQGFITGAVTDAAIEFIDRNPVRPFFCYVAYNAPHSPFQAPDALYEKYVAAGCDAKLASVYAMVEDIDANFGRLLDHLEQRGREQDTIVWFLTDNGPNTARFNGQMRGRKASVDEGGVRVPSAVRCPGRIKSGVEHRGVAAHVDVVPTLLGFLGVGRREGPPLDGVDLSGRLGAGETDGDPDRLHFSHHIAGIGKQSPVPGSVRTATHRAVNRRGEWELYDMTTDPGQRHDVAEDEPELTRRLASAYDAWFDDVGRDAWRTPRTEVGHAAQPVVTLPAHEAYLRGESPRYRYGQGWANDWLTGWDDRGAAEWSLRVVGEGDCEVEVEYAANRAGATLEIACGDAVATLTNLPAFDGPVLPSRDRDPRTEAPDRRWGTARLGPLRLPAGEHTLELRLRPHGAEVDIKSIRLTDNP